MTMSIFDIIKALALLIYIVMIPFAWFGDHNKSREFFEEHKILQALVGGMALLGGILFLIDLCTGKIT